MKIKYPIEAFALAMIVFSKNMQEALVSGIIIFIVTLLGVVLNKTLGAQLPNWSRRLCNIIFIMSLTYSLFQVIMIGFFNHASDSSTIFIHLIIGAFIVKHVLEVEGYEDIGRLSIEGISAYAALGLIGFIREFASVGSILGFSIVDLTFMTTSFQNIVFGFMFAGIALAILNYIFGNKSDKLSSFFVIIPPILVNRPFLIDNINESISILITIIITIVILISVKQYITFSRVSKEWKRLPIDLISASIIYLILRVF